MADSVGKYIIFGYSGKTMMGKIHLDTSTTAFVNDSVQHVLELNDVYYIYNPAEIVFDLTIPSSGSADLNWEVKPMYFKDVLSTDVASTDVVFAFPKS